MGHFHVSAKVGSRGGGKSAVASSAYRAAEKLTDFQTGEVKNFSRKQSVEATAVLAPSEAPDWVYNREQLWNQAEQAERRSDARLYREFEVSLPRELPAEQRLDVVSDWARANFVSRGVVCDVAVHNERASDGGDNPHAHVMVTERRPDPETASGFSARKERSLDGRALVEQVRQSWEHTANQALAQAQSETRIDHRSLEAQRQEALERGDWASARALEREPEPKVGVAAVAMERRGETTERGELWRQVRDGNQRQREYRALLEELEAEIAQEQQRQDDAWVVTEAVTDLMGPRKSLEQIKTEADRERAQQRAQQPARPKWETQTDLQIKLFRWFNQAADLGRSQTYLNKISQIDRDVALRGHEAMTEPAHAAMQRDAQQWEAQQQRAQSAAGDEQQRSRERWAHYSRYAEDRPVRREREVAQLALRDGYDREAAERIVREDPHTREIAQRQGDAKAQKHAQQIVRAAATREQWARQQQRSPKSQQAPPQPTESPTPEGRPQKDTFRTQASIERRRENEPAAAADQPSLAGDEEPSQQQPPDWAQRLARRQSNLDRDQAQQLRSALGQDPPQHQPAAAAGDWTPNQQALDKLGHAAQQIERLLARTDKRSAQGYPSLETGSGYRVEQQGDALRVWAPLGNEILRLEGPSSDRRLSVGRNIRPQDQQKLEQMGNQIERDLAREQQQRLERERGPSLGL